MQLPKKSLGQNFLIDKNIVKKILALSIIQDRHIIEIGPGKGALTDEILKKEPASLILIEKDYELSEILKKKYLRNKKIKIFNKDILKFDLENVLKKNSIIIGNLPYNISSQILIKIVKFKKWLPNFLDLIFMFQKEVGDKIIGKYQTSNYGRISIFTHSRLNIINKFTVSPNCFKPKPKVNSMVIHFRPKKMKFKIKNLSSLEKITNIFFSNKRKMINKVIKKLLTQKQIRSLGDIDLKIRPSEIQEDIYYKITQLSEKN